MKHPLLTALCILLLASTGFAQTDSAAAPADDALEVPGTWMVVASGGWTFPYEPKAFDEHFKTNFNFGGGIAYAMAPGEVGYGEVSLLFHYYNVLFTRSGFRAANAIPDNVAVYGYPGDVFTGMLQFRGVYGSSMDRIAPYFTIGVGVFHVATPGLGIVNQARPLFDEYTSTTVGWSVGLGVDVPVMSRITLFGDGRFLLGATETNGHKLFQAGGGVRYKL